MLEGVHKWQCPSFQQVAFWAYQLGQTQCKVVWAPCRPRADNILLSQALSLDFWARPLHFQAERGQRNFGEASNAVNSWEPEGRGKIVRSLSNGKEKRERRRRPKSTGGRREDRNTRWGRRENPNRDQNFIFNNLSLHPLMGFL